MRYKHLRMYEREGLELHVRTGPSLRAAARHLGRAVSSLSRELARNSTREGYCARAAQQQAEHRQKTRRRPRRFDDKRIERQVKKGLLQDHSPEQIVGMWPASRPRVSVQTIYTYIKRERPEWLRHLRQGRARLSPSYRQPRKYQRIRNITPITERPRVINERGRVGDWESDTIRGSDRHAGSATHVDRRTGYVVLAKVMDRSATSYIHATVAAFARHALGLPMRSFTVDLGCVLESK